MDNLGDSLFVDVENQKMLWGIIQELPHFHISIENEIKEEFRSAIAYLHSQNPYVIDENILVQINRLVLQHFSRMLVARRPLYEQTTENKSDEYMQKYEERLNEYKIMAAPAKNYANTPIKQGTR